MIGKYLEELYNLYTQEPYLSYKQLSEYLADKYNHNINDTKIRQILNDKFTDISEVKKINRNNLKGITNEQFQMMYKLRTEKDYSYEMLIKYLEEEFNIKSNYSRLSKVMKAKFDDIEAKFKEHRNERFFKKNGKTITNEERKTIIELLAEGYTQKEVADLAGISGSYVSRILSKSKLEIEEIKKNRILIKINNCSIDSIRDWWEENFNISYVEKKISENGNSINYNELRYLLKYILGVEKKCRLCSKAMDFDTLSPYCSNACRKEARRDSIRNQQSNRRVKGSGKTTQSISKFKKIREAKGMCYLCEEKLDIKQKDKYHPCYIVLDHVEPLVHSNNSSAENLRAVCRCCNNMKSDKDKNFYNTEKYRQNKKEKLSQYIPKDSDYDEININEFIEDCNAGMTFSELCKKYNRSNSVTWRIKENLGLNNKEKVHVKLDNEFATKEVAKLTREGKNIAEISKILNVSQPTVSNYRKKAVLKGLLESNLSKKNKLSNEIKEELIHLIELGKRDEEIIDILKVSKTTVWKYRKNLNS
ncbi:HNH endonuclease [Clostridium tertium]